MAISRARKTLLTGLATILAVTATAFGVTEAVNGRIATAATGDGMPYAVEDLNYPGAAKIEAETGAILKRGDGHLLLMSCDGTEDLMIKSRIGQKNFCFNVMAKPAFLTLEIPQAYGIWTSADPVKTTIKNGDGSTTVINAPANDFTGYGEAGEVGGEPTTLIELRVAG
ncbi:hypothetical protein OHU11_03680 [Streptomyces sp. NBC_00257]|uniref:hypothetical protein n=1 Tax=unclassified Streptomyces TaxID=2593676 RepID=UPI00225AFB20|nr:MULTISPECIES: hypothetical protein [unclassified Streptomyces]MCX4870843.1 hypothetical protein [Streptomyces sp. NBC_00906]MCX4901583.1 hypothetical protein [Streptomyces sp. NBC_00892]MCX5426826.1 hypothetical protein [Streptomyces sp. NBC_00062]